MEEQERVCNTCGNYDPVEGVCKRTGESHYGYDGEDCEKWKDWEETW